MDNKIFLKHLESILEKHQELTKNSKHNDLSDLPKSDRQSLITRCISAVDRISGAGSIYSSEIKRVMEKKSLITHSYILSNWSNSSFKRRFGIRLLTKFC